MCVVVVFAYLFISFYQKQRGLGLYICILTLKQFAREALGQTKMGERVFDFQIGKTKSKKEHEKRKTDVGWGGGVEEWRVAGVVLGC